MLAVGGLVSWHFSSVVLVPDHNQRRAAVDGEGSHQVCDNARPLRRSRPPRGLRPRVDESAAASTPNGTAWTHCNTPRTSNCQFCSSTESKTTSSRSEAATSSQKSFRTGSPTTGCRRRDTPNWNVDPHLYEARLSQKPCKAVLSKQEQNEPGRWGRARILLNEEPAATYSPRGLPPKYHRRRVA
jgi:hypothetical protein